MLDALAYGEFAPGQTAAGEGAPAPDVPSGSSLARVFADLDTGDNAADFLVLEVPTRGAPRRPLRGRDSALPVAGSRRVPLPQRPISTRGRGLDAEWSLLSE